MLLFWLSLLVLVFFSLGGAVQVGQTEEYKAMGYPDARKIVRDSADNLYVAYRKKYVQDNVEEYHIFVSKSIDGGQTWQLANGRGPIEQVGDYNQRVPAIAIDSADTLHVVWYGNDAESEGKNERQIKYSRSADRGRTWSDWVNLAQIHGYRDHGLWQEHPTIYAQAVDGANRLYVAWQGRDRDYDRSQVKFIMSPDGGHSWNSWVNVSPSEDMNYSRPTIVTSPDGGIIYLLAYRGADGRQQIVWTQSTDDGLTWAPWAPVAAGDCDQRHVSVAVDGRGNLHAVWRQRPCTGGDDDRPSQIHYAVYDGTWSRPVMVGPNPAAYQVFPTVTVTADQMVWVAWSETDEASSFPKENPGSGSIFYTSGHGEDWSKRSQVREATNDVYPSLGRHLPGRGQHVDLVWLDNVDSADNSICYQRLH